ncbi:MAG: hypothetical protein ACKPKO_31570 [Candidatus Fonsibacter sp.]
MNSERTLQRQAERLDIERRRLELDLAEAETTLMRIQKNNKDDPSSSMPPASGTIMDDGTHGKTHKQKQNERRRAMAKHKDDRICDVEMMHHHHMEIVAEGLLPTGTPSARSIITEIVAEGLLPTGAPSALSRRLLPGDCCLRARPRHAPPSSSASCCVHPCTRPQDQKKKAEPIGHQ